jgi:Protein of unknown function (DUF1344)
MRIAGSLVVAAALMGAPLVAYAATTTGDISHIDTARNSLVLDNGSSFHAPRRAELSHLKVGEKVSVVYTVRRGKLDALAIRRASLEGKNPGLHANFGG